jgi:arylsulfatase A-like enzyme
MSQPNVILIMCDQLRYDCLGYAGHPLVKTPHLDRLAEQGVVFETAYCASPVCSPARASWLTGTYPHAHNQLANYGPEKIGTPGVMMNEDAITLGDLFKGAGYRCGISGPWHLGNDHQPQHGFTDFWHAYRYQGEGHPDPFFDFMDREGVSNLYSGSHESIVSGYGLSYTPMDDSRQQRTTWTINQGIEFLDTQDDRPFFLFLSVKDPHPLIVVSQELVDQYPVDEIELPPSWRDPLEGKPEYQHKEHSRLSLEIDDAGFKQMMAYYYALVTHIDAEVGKLVAHLDQLGFGDDTVLAFISDHGEMLGDHHTVEKRLFYEASSRVPCLLSWPDGFPKGFTVTTPFGGVDLMPTLLDLAGVSFDHPVDGRSVADAIVKGEQPELAPVFSEIASRDGIRSLSTAPEELAARVMVRDGDWKYVWNRMFMDELYDMEADPNEMKNLAEEADQQDRVEQMRGLIREMVQKTGPGVYDWCA